MTDAIGDDLIKQVVAAGFMGDGGEAFEAEVTNELFSAIFGAATDCGVDLS